MSGAEGEKLDELMKKYTNLSRLQELLLVVLNKV